MTMEKGTANAAAEPSEGSASPAERVRRPAWDLGEGSLTLGAGVRLLLWDYSRGSLAYDLALALIALVVLLVPGSFWGDPLWRP